MSNDLKNIDPDRNSFIGITDILAQLLNKDN
jgi:hypothetical protein